MTEDAEKLDKKDAKELEKKKGFVEKKYFVCKKCGDLEFKDEDEIILHFKQMHPPPPPKTYICNDCDNLEFKDEYEIDLHFMQIHPPPPLSPLSPLPSMTIEILDWLNSM